MGRAQVEFQDPLAPKLHFVRMVAIVRVAVRVAVTVRVAVARVVAIIKVMMHFRRGNPCFFQLVLKSLFNPRVFLIRLNLLHI